MQQYAKAADDFRTLLQLKPNDTDALSRLNYAEAKLYSVHSAPFTPIPHRAAEQAARKARAAREAAARKAQVKKFRLRFRRRQGEAISRQGREVDFIHKSVVSPTFLFLMT